MQHMSRLRKYSKTHGKAVLQFLDRRKKSGMARAAGIHSRSQGVGRFSSFSTGEINFLKPLLLTQVFILSAFSALRRFRSGLHTGLKLPFPRKITV